MIMMVVIFGLIFIFNAMAFTAYALYFSLERDRRRSPEQNALGPSLVTHMGRHSEYRSQFLPLNHFSR